jgi:hypothetical protein
MSVPAKADVIAGARRLVPEVRAAREECEETWEDPARKGQAMTIANAISALSALDADPLKARR